MPTPGKNETQDDFISRCMGNDQILSEFSDEKQRAAVCYSKFKAGKESHALEGLSKALSKLNRIKKKLTSRSK